MRIPGDRSRGPSRREILVAAAFLGLMSTMAGCGGEPSQREVRNAQAFEALLTAVSLRNDKEVEADSRLIEKRHDAGEMSDAKYREIEEIIRKARSRDWAGAEKRAYEFRAQFGDEGSFFK